MLWQFSVLCTTEGKRICSVEWCVRCDYDEEEEHEEEEEEDDDDHDDDIAVFCCCWNVCPQWDKVCGTDAKYLAAAASADSNLHLSSTPSQRGMHKD
jgi:hypothetical protein